jgi:CrcB protein
MTWMLVGLGGGIGAILRYSVGRFYSDRSSSTFPLGTLTANLTGSLLIGLIFGWLLERNLGDSRWHTFLVVGLLGGYTTFSAFAFETVSMLEDRQYTQAATYVLVSNVIGLAACAIGIAIARQLA